MMTKINLTIIIIMFRLFMVVYSGRLPVAGNYDPFLDENQLQQAESDADDQPHVDVNLPSHDAIHDHIHQSSDNSKAASDTDHNNPPLEKAGPSLDLIDSHAHKDEHPSTIDQAKRPLIQPSIDILDAKLHGGKEHVHDQNQTEGEAPADLNDFRRWLQEQNQTSQLNRFLSLQEEVKQYHLDNTPGLNDKLNRTIEEILSTNHTKPPFKHDL